MKKIVMRIIGQNLGGGARKHCFILNCSMIAMGYNVKTFIPEPKFLDPLSHQSLVKMDYKHKISPLYLGRWIMRNRYRLLCIHSHLRNATIIADFFANLFHLPHIITVHGPLYEGNPNLKDRLILWLFSRAMQHAKLVIFISDFVRLTVLEQTKTSSSDIVSKVIYNGSEDAVIEAEYMQKRSVSGNLKICIVGELTERKNMADLIWLTKELALVARTKDVHVTIKVYGEGPFRNELEAIQEEFGCLSVRGYAKKASDIYLNNDLHMILSKTEGFGRVVTEAMSYGIPTIAYESGAFPELITHGIDGFLVSNCDSLLRLILELVADPFRLKEIGQVARKTYEKRFTDQAFAENTIYAIDAVLQSSPKL